MPDLYFEQQHNFFNCRLLQIIGGALRVSVYYCLLSFQGDLFTGALFIQQSLRWDLYLCIFVLVIITGILTMTGKTRARNYNASL